MSTVAEPLQLLFLLILAVYVINLGYAFRGSCERLGDYRFQSRLLSGGPPATPPKIGNRFRDTWLSRLPVPLPRDYVQGIDRQRADFEEGARSYLHGHWSPRGWWYYYLVGLGIKLPLGTLALLALTAIIYVANALRRISVGNGLRAVPPAARAARLARPPGEGRGEGPDRRATSHGDARQAGKPDLRGRDELFLLSCGIAILALVSSQTGFSAHVRYAIPALPYVFIWCGKLFADSAASHTNPKRRRGARGQLGRLAACLPRWRFGFVWLCVAASAAESLIIYPHSISFFNRLIGGPAHGHEWLLDSNSAWGQDLIYLKEWVESHPEARPLRVATVGWLDPAVLGIDYTIPRVGPSRPITAENRETQNSLSLRESAGVRAGGVTIDHRSHHAPRDVSAVNEFDAYQVPQTWQDVRSPSDLGPRPGWYAIDVNFLHGTHWPATRRPWHFQEIAEEGLNYEYFRLFEPRDRVAYSYLIYRVTAEEAAAARRELGLPPL